MHAWSRCLRWLLFAILLPWPIWAASGDLLVSRPRPTQPADKQLAAGTRLQTGPGETRRLLLPDRSLLFVRERTQLQLLTEGKLELSRGEIFIESASGKLAPALTVKTPQRQLNARDGRFGVRADAGGTRVLVASGSVRVEGVDRPLLGGQILSEKATEPQPAPRLSHLVAWTRELRNAAPLVPASEHAGGTLIARTPEGQEAKLELRRYHVDVHIEDGFARTTIDQTFFNQTQDRLEGTFRFPLPQDASLSRLAMYVDGKLMEGGMAERDHARSAYERILHEQRDPALLEWVDGSTFKLRVFPLEPRQEKRLLLSYTQKLPALYGSLNYRFPAGHSLGQVKQWSFQARVSKGNEMGWQCESHALEASKEGNDLLLRARLADARLDRDVVLHLDDPSMKEPGAGSRFATMEQDGARYLLVRHRPDLSGASEPQKRDWVVLMESSGDRDPLLMRTQIELLRALLQFSGRDDSLVILTAGTRARVFQPKAVRNDLEAIEEAMAALEKVHLVGALDLAAALTAARPHLEAAKNPHLLHIGSGIAAMGTANTPELLKRIPRGTRYVGVGVGRRWNRSFMQAAAESSGGLFTQVNPDEQINWRGLELAATLNTPRLVDVRVSDPAGRATFLPFVRLVNQGEEVAAVCQVSKGELPRSVKITGRLEGKDFERELKVEEGSEKASYLPRSWAKLEIERLLGEDAQKHRDRVIDLSKAMYVLTPFTSLLVLENDDMYTQFKVDRGRKDHWAMYPAPAQIKVVYEPLEGDPGDPKKGIKPAAKVVRNSVPVRTTPDTLKGESGQNLHPPSLALVVRDSSLSMLGGFAMRAGTTRGVDGVMLLGDGQGENIELQSLKEVDEKRPMLRTFGRPAREDAAADMPVSGTAPERASARFRLRLLESLEASRQRHDFTNTDLGMDDSVSLAYNADRIEEISISGQLASGKYAITRSLLYRRPNYSNDERLYFDLLSYAPGLNTSVADVRAVLEAEGRRDPQQRPGRVADKARTLIDRARQIGWRRYSISQPGTPDWTILFDGSGRYSWQRTLGSGLREQVVCDGATLWHCYPQLGLVSRRDVSRFHRQAFASLVPWAVPRAEDLAVGQDVVMLDDNTVALVPHARKDSKGNAVRQPQLQLVFGNDGQLRERRLLEMPGKKLLARETYSAEGHIRHTDGDGKELLSLDGKLEGGDEPGLKPAVENLVVVSMPFRSLDHVRKTHKLTSTPNNRLTFEQARLLLCAAVAAGDAGTAQTVFREALANRDQRQLGYYVLLAAGGVNLDGDNLDVLDAHPHEPLAQYLALQSSPVLRKHASRWAAASNTFTDRFLRRLTLGHALCQRWLSGKTLGTSAAQRKSERDRAMAFVKEEKGSELAWALLGLVQDRTSEEKEDEPAQAAWKDLAAAYALFSDHPSLGELAIYEQARCLFRSGQKAEAQKRFLALYRQARKADRLLFIDDDFRSALLFGEKDLWSETLRQTAAELVKQDRRQPVLWLARQCWQLGDQPMAQSLFTQAMMSAQVKDKDALPLYQNAVRWLLETHQYARADALLQSLLADAEHGKQPDLWRLAMQVAQKRDQPGRHLECLERALELHFARLPEVIDLEQVRSDYRTLLEKYDALTRAMQTLGMPLPTGFRGRVVRAADRWRALDREQSQACKQAASVLRRLGERELSWDYLTTPVALQPGESEVWINLAHTLRSQGESDLADRAFASAFEREATNADILWERAENLRQTGRLAQAQALYRQLAEGDWQPRFRHLKSQARWQLDKQ